MILYNMIILMLQCINASTSMGLYGTVWACMGLYGPVWACMAHCMGLYGPDWACMTKTQIRNIYYYIDYNSLYYYTLY